MSEIVDAVLKTQETVGRLGKADFNAHGKYNFVSIDTYYAQVASVAGANGLTWIARVTSASPYGEKGIRLDYTFDLMHSSGGKLGDVFQHPIIHPVQGAQTAGSALSYADKLFMRHVFKVVTGEGDADDTAPNSLEMPAPAVMPPAAVKPPETKPLEPLPPSDGAMADDELTQAVRKVASGMRRGKPVLHVPDENSDFALVELVLTVFVDLCRNKEELIWFWSDNIAAIDAMLKLAPEAHSRIKTAFVARKAQVPETADAR